MKRTALALVLFASLAFVVNAQPTTRLKQCPQAFRTFYAKFSAAVLRTDKNAVISATKFPFRWAFDAGDEGKYTRSQFLRNYGKLFDRDTRDFLRVKNPYCTVMEKGEIDIMSEYAMHLNFERSGRTYRFAGYFIEP